jgi:hypothetical protein
MASTRQTKDGAKDFETVRAAEIKYIQRRRQKKGAAPPEPGTVSESLVGLAFSGGGIRSATTNLGVAQALSRMGILRMVDYLSTVSGGGYIGGCLSALLSINSNHRHLAGKDEQFTITSRDDLKFNTDWEDFPFNPKRPTNTPQHGLQATPGMGTKLVAHLRTHGDFLIARRSILKREALRAVGNLVGGILYTLLMALLSLAVATLLLLGAAHALSRDVAGWKDIVVQPSVAESETRYIRAGETIPAVAAREATDPDLFAHLSHRLGLIWDAMTSQIGAGETLSAVFAGVGVTVLVTLMLMVATKKWKGPREWPAGESREDAFEIRLLRVAAGMLTFAAVVVPLANALFNPNRPSASWLLQPLFVVGGAYVSALLLYAVFALLGNRELFWTRGTRSLGGSYLAITLYGTLVTLVFAILPAASYAAYAVGVSGVFGPILSLVVGRVLMTKPVTHTAERFEFSKALLHILLGIVVALLIALTMVEVGALAIHKDFVDPLAGRAYWLALGATAGGLLLLCFLVDLNRMGLHYFYRDRIIETYLRSEIANENKGPEEGRMETFVDTMEMRLKDVHGRPVDDNEPGNTAPYLLVSAALNLAGSRDLTRKDRKSGYFLFSKYFVGSRQTGYRDTKEYQSGRIQLSRALTLSGAAAGTGMGYQTFFAQSFLTALFNIRLGQWISNPRTNRGDRYVFWPPYILREVLGHTTERTKLVNVSDGGHTGDNVGIYPLLERRCQVIIASDAEADPAIAFGSLTEAMRHAYVDLGIDIDIDLSMITPDATTGLSKSHCAIGRIRYPECPHRPSWLIYMKNSMTGNEPAPILNYKKTSPVFPHESTADQFFDDAQFESYRALGDHIAEETFARWILDPEVRRALDANAPEPKAQCGHVLKGWHLKPRLVWDGLRIQHSPFKAADSTEFRELTQQLGELEQLFLETPSLTWYYVECMDLPGKGIRPDDAVVPVNVIAMQIQLMEDTYFAVRLDLYANARDNRGWMNLFRRWGRSDVFNDCFGDLHWNYSNDFVAFYCNYIQNWREIDYLPIPHAWDVAPDLDENDEYTHPSAVICAGRKAPGLFQDNGRMEAQAPEPGERVKTPVIHPPPGLHGGSGTVDESRSPTATPPPPESGKE